MRSHELAEQLMEQDDAEVVVDIYDSTNDKWLYAPVTEVWPTSVKKGEVDGEPDLTRVVWLISHIS
jgi:hypothetical protein